MQISRRNFLTVAGLGILAESFGSGSAIFKPVPLKLDEEFIQDVKIRIENEILTAMEKIYFPNEVIFNEKYRPDLKYREKIVSFYDYQACGISVLAVLALKGDKRAKDLISAIQKNCQYYCQHIFGQEIEGSKFDIPLRRILLHLALAYRILEPTLKTEEKKIYLDLVEQQVPLAIRWNEDFFPGKGDLYMNTNNHNAIFMQGIFYCGKVFNHPEWEAVTLDFAKRMYDSVNPDGYFEEMSNKERESGPSLVYTRLTMGCLYDVLNGKERDQEKFRKAGDFYRSFVNYNYQMIPLADERTNSNGDGIDYGLALHSMTSKGRYFIVDNLSHLDYGKLTVEDLAVIYHELNLMRTGSCSLPENRTKGNSRISLPLGIVRENGFTAGVSALLALNRTLHPKNDYHLDHQNMVYLSHEKRGVILTGYKSKKNPAFSTFRIGEDAYTIKTGDLIMGKGWAEATLYYKTFTAKIRWEVSNAPRLILTTDSDQTITSAFPLTDEKYLKSANNYKIRLLDGFSPYTQGNKEGKIKAAVFEWKKELIVEFKI